MAGFDLAQWAKDRAHERDALRRLAKLEDRARLVIGFEKMWPSIVAALTICGALLTLILIGVFDQLPAFVRGLSFAVSIGVAIAIVLRGYFSFRSTREDQLDRIDRDTALDHRPALSLADFSAPRLDDPVTFALWNAHRDNLLKATQALQLSWPRPRVFEKDPYALRFGVVIALVAALLVGGAENLRRVETAMIWTGPQDALAGARIDGWIDPPPYTGLPPILFDFQSGQNERSIRAPVNAKIVLRRSDSMIELPQTAGALTPDTQVGNPNERHFTLNGDASISAHNVGGGSIVIGAIPDKPPSIQITGNAETLQNGSLALPYQVADDYGIASGTTDITNPRTGTRPLAGEKAPLVPAPDYELAPPAGKREATGRVIFEIGKSPWAGATVDVRLTVKDDAGQVAKTESNTIRLPERLFSIPVAKALIEERRRLALDPSMQPRVREAVDLLMTSPEFFSPPAAEYLGLRSIRSALDGAKSDDELRDIIDLMWDVAVALEAGGTSDAEKALSAAQEALRQALENGASDEEISALTDKLKEALDNYLRDYAARAMRQMEQAGEQPQPQQQGRAIRPEDLKSMLDRMQDMAKNGAREEATRMLDALSSILKNLQASRPRLANPSDNAGEQALNGLDKMMRDQRGLRDDTFRQGRVNPEAGSELGNRQQSLRDELQALREAMKGLGEEGEQALGEAGEAMGRAGDALKQGDIPGALREQNKALESMRSGAQALAQAMQGQEGEGEGEMQQGQSGEPRNQLGRSQQRDPLGRENGNMLPDDGTLNEKGGASTAGERARNVLDELRKRLSEEERSKNERDYFRRLIGPN